MSTQTNNIDNFEAEIDTFRNSLGTADKSGKRKWVYPKKPSGRYYNWRTYFSWILLAFFVISPFIKINSNPLFKFDFLKREFFILSYPVFMSDFKIFAIAGVASIVFIILFTVVYGRIFCGWICPQTILLEMVFRKIEYAIEGDRNKQMKLDKQAWDEEKLRKRGMKWLIYMVLSFLIANIFFSWMFGVDEMLLFIKEGPIEHLTTFFILLIFTATIYFIFTWFREQACVMVCPYGRLQGVLIDRKTIIVAYDYKRGEREIGRGKFKRGEDRRAEGKGDCIDCGQCVVVCPTGIDIRNGTQLECVNCTACIDACDDVMTKINLPIGLIRYASEENIAEEKPFRFTPRMMAYSVVLVLLMTVLTSFLLLRSDVNSKFLRVPGTDYKMVENLITNQFEYNLQNKTKETKQMHIELSSHPSGTISLDRGSQNLIIIPGGQEIQGKMTISIPQEDVKSYKERIRINVLDENNKIVDSYSTSFAAPFR